MKRFLLAFSILPVILSVSTPALAGKAKVPKAVCFSFMAGSTQRYLVVTTKKISKLPIPLYSTGKQPHLYSVQGAQNYDGWWAPLSGSGYYLRTNDPFPNQYFRAHVTSQQADHFYSISLNFFLDNGDYNWGEMDLYRTETGAVEEDLRLEPHDCEALELSWSF
jgi:hypothetical protein